MKLIWSTPTPIGNQAKPGPERVVYYITKALEKKYGDELGIITGEGMPESAQRLDPGPNFDERAIFAVDEMFRKFGQPRLFFGTNFCSLLQMHQLEMQAVESMECKKMILHMSSESTYVAKLLSPMYAKHGAGAPISEEQLWRGEEEHKLADAVVVPNGPCAQTYRKSDALKHKKVFAVDFGVDSELFHPELDKKLPGFSVLYAGGNTIRKGLDDLLVAWGHFVGSLAPSERAKVQLGLLSVPFAQCQACGQQYGTSYKSPVCARCKQKGTIQLLWQPSALPPRVAMYGWVSDENMPSMYRQHKVFTLSTFEEGQNLSCVTPDTLIITSKGVRKISEINVGDAVLTHKGRFRAVTRLFSRPYMGRYVRIKLFGMTCFPLTITANHPIFAIKRPKRTRLPERPKSYVRRWDILSPSWIAAKDIRQGDVIQFPLVRPIVTEVSYDMSAYTDSCDEVYAWSKMGFSNSGILVKIQRRILLNVELARVIGWYVAEGSYSNNQFIFALSDTEKTVAEWIVTCLYTSFGVKSVIAPSHGHGIRVRCSSSAVGEFFRSRCGEGAQNKRIPPEILYGSNLAILRAFIEAYMQGDGHYVSSDVSRGNDGLWIASTISLQLATDLLIALIRLGLKPRVQSYVNNSGNMTYRVSHTEHNENFRHSIKGGFGKEGDLMLLIKDVQDVPNGELPEVRNLEVEEDNSYVTLAGSIHNCWEALASGLPLITTRESGTPITDGEEGFFVKPGDPKAIEEKLQWYYTHQDGFLHMAEAARALAIRYPWERFQRQIINSVEDLLQE